MEIHCIMIQEILKSWWVFLLRGVLLLLFAVICFLMPLSTVAILALWTGAFILVDGVFLTVGVIFNWKQYQEKWLLLLAGVMSILLGVLVLRRPDITAIALMLMMAMWAIVIGVSRIAIGIQLRKVMEGEGWVIASGVLTVLFGVLLAAIPGIGLISLAFFLGISASLLGMFQIVMAFRMRRWKKQLSPPK